MLFSIHDFIYIRIDYMPEVASRNKFMPSFLAILGRSVETLVVFQTCK